jgi:hypothetical protein
MSSSAFKTEADTMRENHTHMHFIADTRRENHTLMHFIADTRRENHTHMHFIADTRRENHTHMHFIAGQRYNYYTWHEKCLHCSYNSFASSGSSIENEQVSDSKSVKAKVWQLRHIFSYFI